MIYCLDRYRKNLVTSGSVVIHGISVAQITDDGANVGNNPG